MFKSEAKLFLSATNNLNYAKTLINECKSLIVDFDFEGNSDCKNLKSNINNCNINALVTKVEDTKESLMKLDQGFASEYMTLLQEFLQTSTIDTSNMTDEEKMQYSIQMDVYARDYNQNLLYMLEKYEESGTLTDEMKQQLQYQKKLVAQYDIQDKMTVLDTTTDEYINLFKQYANYDRKLINLNPSLSEEEKNSYLKEYNTQYDQNLSVLINSRDARLKREKDLEELEDLYALKEDNNNFWHLFVKSEIDEAILDKKIAMGIASEDEIEYKNMNTWDRFWTNTGTFAASTYTGLFKKVKKIEDSFLLLGSAVSIVDKEWTSDYIKRDISGELYQGIQLSTGMNSYSAYGTWHTVGEAFGDLVGGIGTTFASPWASALINGLSAMGQSAETSFNNGDDYWIAYGKSVVSGIGGAAEGYGLAKLNLNIRDFVSKGTLKVLRGTAWSGIKNFGTTLTSPEGLKIIGGNLWNLAKSGVNHAPSALRNAALATLKEPDAHVEAGCVLTNNVIECLQSGEWNFEKMIKETGTVYSANYLMSFAEILAFDINTKKPNLDTTGVEHVLNADTTNSIRTSNYILEYSDQYTYEEIMDAAKVKAHTLSTADSTELLDSYIDEYHEKITIEVIKEDSWNKAKTYLAESDPTFGSLSFAEQNAKCNEQVNQMIENFKNSSGDTISERLKNCGYRNDEIDVILADTSNRSVTAVKNAQYSVMGLNGESPTVSSIEDYYSSMSKSDSGGLNDCMTHEARNKWLDKFSNGNGTNRVSSIYSNDNLKYVINTPDEKDTYKLMYKIIDKEPVIEVDMSNKSFGRKGDMQFVSPESDSDRLFENITKSKEKINVQGKVGEATGLPSSNSDRLVRISLDTDQEVKLHSGIEAGSNSQRLPGGLPAYKIDDKLYRMDEGVIGSIGFSTSTNWSKTNLNFDYFDNLTGELYARYKLQEIEGKTYLVLQ